MTRPRPHLVRLGDLAAGQSGDFFALLADKSRGATRDGKAFYHCRFRDARRAASFMAWADGPWFAKAEADWQAGHFYKLRATYSEHERYGPQLTDLELIRPVKDADRADGFDPALLVESSRYEAAALLEELKALVAAAVRDEPLRRLVLGLLDRHAADLKRLPATRDRYFPFAGGLVEHTLSVVKSCLWLADRYAAHYPELKPTLNRDLIVAAAALHEIGRTCELGPEEAAPRPTPDGLLFGHLLLGRDLVRDAARAQGDVSPELLRLLEHVLLSYLALPEWGSPRLPLVPEALVLHHADDLDAKLEMYVRCLTRDRAEGPLTDRDPALNRQLLKGRDV
jgi:3'-5' exoribonuclease